MRKTATVFFSALAWLIFAGVAFGQPSPLLIHDGLGAITEGSLQSLQNAVRAGKQIRVQYRSENGDYLWVRRCDAVVEGEGDVTCFVFNVPDTALVDRGLDFRTPLFFEHQAFRSNGAFSMVKFSLGDGKERKRTTGEPKGLSWFAD